MSFFSWLKELFCGRDCQTIKELAEYAKKDPSLLGWWMDRNMTYKKDATHSEEWQNPELALQNRKCDCEEWASIVALALRHMGYISHIVGIYDGTKGHALCVFYEYTRWNYIDTSGYSNLGANSIEECVLECAHSRRLNVTNYAFYNEQGEMKGSLIFIK